MSLYKFAVEAYGEIFAIIDQHLVQNISLTILHELDNSRHSNADLTNFLFCQTYGCNLQV